MPITKIKDYEPGKLIDDRYLITEYISKGGQATVYKALETKTQSVFALKIYNIFMESDIDDVKQEFMVLHRLASNKAVMDVYEIFGFENRYVMVMELVQGMLLSEYISTFIPAVNLAKMFNHKGFMELQQVEQSKIPYFDTLPYGKRLAHYQQLIKSNIAHKQSLVLFGDYVQFISYIVSQLLELVVQVHQLGIMHRDLNPGNVMVINYNNPRIKLIDFGLSTTASRLNQSAKANQPRDLAGTPCYIAPEVRLPTVNSERCYGLKCDLWSVGCIFYYLVAGYPPFLPTSYLGYENFQLGLGRGEVFYLPLDLLVKMKVPAFYSQLIGHLLQFDPTKRFSAAQALQFWRFNSQKNDFGKLLMQSQDSAKIISVLILGNAGVGKTTLLRRILTQKSEIIGAQNDVLYLKVKEPNGLEGDIKSNPLPSFYRNAQVCLLVFKFGDSASIQDLREWKAQAEKFNENCLFFVVGNFVDEYQELSADELELIGELGADFLSVSGRTGENLQSFLSCCIMQCIQKGNYQEVAREALLNVEGGGKPECC